MTQTPPDLAALIGSRICHDLISPLGAIGNGVELLAMSLPPSPELDLVAESVANAQARIRMFRLAFGAVKGDERIAGREIATILEGLALGGRLRFEWTLPADLPRAEAKLLLLLVQCLETALPWGGDVSLSQQGDHWSLQARAERQKLDPELWEPLAEGRSPADPTGAQVHFALIPALLASTGRQLHLVTGPEGLAITL